MVRGIERRALFRDERDRADFVARVAALAAAQSWRVVAWALLPNPAHLLVRTGRQPLAAAMRSLLTGYAGAFSAAYGGQAAGTSGTAISSRTGTSPSWWRRSPTSRSWPATST